MGTTIISVLAILITALESTFDHDKKRKIIAAWIGATIAVIGLIYGNYQARQDEKIKDEKLNTQSNNIIKLTDSISAINFNLNLQEKTNDSLKIVMFTIQGQNDKLLTQSSQIQKNELEHYIQNQIALHDVTQRFGYRHLNQEAENALTNALKKTKGILNIQVSDAGQEGNAFCEQLMRIFYNAGWELHRSSGITAMGVSSGVLIGIDKEDTQVAYSTSAVCQVLALVGYQVYIKPERIFDRRHKTTTPTMDIVILPYSTEAK